MDKDHALEEMMGKLGDFGRYQCFQFILHILAAMTAGMHMLSLVTVAAVPDHRCYINGTDDSGAYSTSWNSSFFGKFIPVDEHGKLHNCKMFGSNMTEIGCESWVYDTKYYTSTLGIEWDFVCERRWMGAIPQTVYMIGVVAGSLILGRLCDSLGRKKVFCWSGVLQMMFGVAVAFTPNYSGFLIVRFLYGVFGSGAYIAGFVLTMELVGGSKRTICGVTFQIFYAIGIILVAFWGYLIDDKFTLQVVYGLHSAVLLPHWILMDESPRWLWAQARTRESVAIVEKALKINGSVEILETAILVSQGKASCAKYNDEPSVGTADLFKTPNMRKKSLIICCCWFANSVVYYGLSLNVGKLNGNPFFIIFLLGIVELPSYIIIMFFLDRTGHRILISSMMLLGGMSCLVVAALPHGSQQATGVVMLGKLFISGSFSIIYKYSAELFPTVVRSSGVGLGSMCASVSGALTPLITLLDSFDPKIPTILFGLLAVVSGVSTFLLPETIGRSMPQSVEDGERFGVGDTCFTNCSGKRLSTVSTEVPEDITSSEINGKSQILQLEKTGLEVSKSLQ